MIVRLASERPVEFTLSGGCVDTRDAPLHQSVIVEFPVLVAAGTKIDAGVVMPFTGEGHGNAVS